MFPDKRQQNRWPLSLWQQVRAMWGDQVSHLPSLTEVTAGRAIADFVYAGRQTVPLIQVRGSATRARSRDFDANFRPLTRHNADRWHYIAAASRRGKQLPPVTLLEVNGVYFVEDGHHRISVAKAENQTAIEAEVTVLQITGALP
ncbi:MAG: hypothetical protein IPM53_17500 [Anaerolineaceae bacterium]|nr:hypothetical protein [Anaerolineaceae bacterium]